LKLGDFISIKLAKLDNFLCAEGILSDDVYVDSDRYTFDDGVFCIQMQQQYSASRELEEFLEAHKDDKLDVEDPNKIKYLNALKVCYKFIHF
jgi:hypothetical protein